MNSSIRNQFCPNTRCHCYKKRFTRNVVSHGRGYPRFKCKICSTTWVAHKNEVHYKLRSPKEKIEKTIGLVRQGLSIRKIARETGVNPGTIINWKKKFIS